MILFFVIREWKKDCERIGKENLAVPLQDRLLSYFGFIIIPAVMAILLAIFR